MGEPLTRITPDTRLSDLLEQFPEVEPVLMELSPSFRKLQNPVLRRTVARIATLRQVATVGRVELSTLLRTVQRAAGLTLSDYVAEDSSEEQRPDWAAPAAVAESWDAREAIEAGAHPLQQVTSDLRELADGQTYELITGFVPAPMIDWVRGRGYQAWSTEEAGGLVRTYIHRPPSAEGDDP